MADSEDYQRYQAYRGQLEYEDQLFNQRITWIVAFQSLIAFPYVYLVVTELQASIQTDKYAANSVYIIDSYRAAVVCAGLVAGALGYVSCAAALHRIQQLKTEYTELGTKPKGLPDLDSKGAIRYCGMATSQGLLWSFFFFWTYATYDLHWTITSVLWVVTLCCYVWTFSRATK